MSRYEMIDEFYAEVKRRSANASAIVLTQTDASMFNLIYAYVTVVSRCVVWQYLLYADGTVRKRWLTEASDSEEEIFTIKA